jgi:hypothetical protein
MDFPVQQVLELACAAQRYNGCYHKESETLFADDGKSMGYKFSNKMMMLWTLDMSHREGSDPQYHPPVLTVTDADKQLTEDIRTYYRRLMFSVLAQPDNQFLQEILSLLNKEMMNENKCGFIACLPSVYERDRRRNELSKISRELDDSYLAPIESKIQNIHATVLDCTRSKNYDAYNVLAIIDNKLASWFSKIPIKEPEVFIALAKVKGHHQHFISKKCETRLNYVKVTK